MISNWIDQRMAQKIINKRQLRLIEVVKINWGSWEAVEINWSSWEAVEINWGSWEAVEIFKTNIQVFSVDIIQCEHFILKITAVVVRTSQRHHLLGLVVVVVAQGMVVELTVWEVVLLAHHVLVRSSHLLLNQTRKRYLLGGCSVTGRDLSALWVAGEELYALWV